VRAQNKRALRIRPTFNCILCRPHNRESQSKHQTYRISQPCGLYVYFNLFTTFKVRGALKFVANMRAESESELKLKWECENTDTLRAISMVPRIFPARTPTSCSAPGLSLFTISSLCRVLKNTRRQFGTRIRAGRLVALYNFLLLKVFGVKGRN